MDLDSWTPTDKARRVAVFIAVYAAILMLVVFWLVLGWPWYLAPLGALVVYPVVFYPSFVVLRSVMRR
ncbi:hypothetical protein V3W47_02930 [Deinococcus sp. YIM 134068]|uniref:hypothetical protein n=1 Tax=Deinococcus lichenicola TaxID=3118910 RepID=UPI002F9201DF